MTKTLPTIVFFGSGPVAAASLSFLADHFPIEAVITKQRAAHHHASSLAPVEKVAGEHGLELYFANNRKDLDQCLAERTFRSRVGIVVDYGVIMSPQAISALPLGIINSHFSLLPQWRGADPITFAILSGQQETGVSLMKIVPALDEGDLLSQAMLPISPTTTTPELTEQLIVLSNKMLLRDIPKYVLGKLAPYPQPNIQASYSRKLNKEDGVIDWTKPATVLEREIRAYADWPKSVATLGNHTVIVKKADVINTTGRIGEFLATKKDLMVYCGEDALNIMLLQPIGKKEMAASAFLAGYKL